MNLFKQKVIQFIQCNLLTILASAGTSTNTRRTSTRTVRVLVNSWMTAAMVIVTGTVTGFLLIIFVRGTDKRPKSKCTVPCPLLVLHHIYTEEFKRTGKSGNRYHKLISLSLTVICHFILCLHQPVLSRDQIPKWKYCQQNCDTFYHSSEYVERVSCLTKQRPLIINLYGKCFKTFCNYSRKANQLDEISCFKYFFHFTQHTLSTIKNQMFPVF